MPEKKGMVKATIDKYLSGKADQETLLQTLAEYRIHLNGNTDVIATKNEMIESLKTDLLAAERNVEILEAKNSRLVTVLSNIRSRASRLWFGGNDIVELCNKNI